jgi:cellobiose phosphorylase
MAFAAQGDAHRAWELFDLVNPLGHARDADGMAVYKIEPYVVAADVYSVAPHTGRGGWSWYTGSAGWMLRLVTESLLGLHLRVTAAGAHLDLVPCLPDGWPGHSVRYRWRSTAYEIDVVPATAAVPAGLTVDGAAIEGHTLALVDDRATHRVRYAVPARDAASAALDTRAARPATDVLR